MRENRIADLAIAAVMMLVVVSLAAVTAIHPAQAREIEPDWTWKVYPTDKTNVQAMQRITIEEMYDKVVNVVEERIAAEEAEREAAEQAALEAEQWAEQQYYEPTYYAPSYSNAYDNDFQQQGVVYDGETTYSWYSQRVLPGDGLTELNNNGRHVASDGFVCDGDGYIAVASCDYAQGEVIDTPFGEAKVYDYCPTSGTVDMYVAW